MGEVECNIVAKLIKFLHTFDEVLMSQVRHIVSSVRVRLQRNADNIARVCSQLSLNYLLLPRNQVSSQGQTTWQLQVTVLHSCLLNLQRFLQLFLWSQAIRTTWTQLDTTFKCILCGSLEVQHLLTAQGVLADPISDRDVVWECDASDCDWRLGVVLGQENRGQVPASCL